jgi:hypothetical protein
MSLRWDDGRLLSQLNYDELMAAQKELTWACSRTAVAWAEAEAEAWAEAEADIEAYYVHRSYMAAIEQAPDDATFIQFKHEGRLYRTEQIGVEDPRNNSLSRINPFVPRDGWPKEKFAFGPIPKRCQHDA